MELVEQVDDLDAFDEIIIASGSALTHAGLLYGLRYLGSRTSVYGICVRRDALSLRKYGCGSGLQISQNS